MDDRAVTADIYCFECLDRWLRVSSNDFTRAPRFHNVRQRTDIPLEAV